MRRFMVVVGLAVALLVGGAGAAAAEPAEPQPSCWYGYCF